jgi:hypothetical protein
MITSLCSIKMRCLHIGSRLWKPHGSRVVQNRITASSLAKHSVISFSHPRAASFAPRASRLFPLTIIASTKQACSLVCSTFASIMSLAYTISQLLPSNVSITILVNDDARGHGYGSFGSQRVALHQSIRDRRWESAAPPTDSPISRSRRPVYSMPSAPRDFLHPSVMQAQAKSEQPLRKPLRRGSTDFATFPVMVDLPEIANVNKVVNIPSADFIEKMSTPHLSSPPVKLAAIQSFNDSIPYKPSRSPCA